MIYNYNNTYLPKILYLVYIITVVLHIYNSFKTVILRKNFLICIQITPNNPFNTCNMNFIKLRNISPIKPLHMYMLQLKYLKIVKLDVNKYISGLFIHYYITLLEQFINCYNFLSFYFLQCTHLFKQFINL